MYKLINAIKKDKQFTYAYYGIRITTLESIVNIIYSSLNIL